MTEPLFETLKLSFDPAGVATLVLARKETSNAIDEVMINELMWAFAVVSSDPRVRVVVLSSSGRTFCSGTDANWTKRGAELSPEANLADARHFASMMQMIHECPKPVIARVQGAALDAGVGLCSVCDIVLAAPQVRFSLSDARLGLVPAVIAPYLVNVIGKREAQRLALTGDALSASRAAELGLVSEVVADEEMDAVLQRLIGQMLANGPEALAETKELFRHLSVGTVDSDTREATAQIVARVRSGDEAREGVAASIEKRAARYALPVAGADAPEIESAFVFPTPSTAESIKAASAGGKVPLARVRGVASGGSARVHNTKLPHSFAEGPVERADHNPMGSPT